MTNGTTQQWSLKGERASLRAHGHAAPAPWRQGSGGQTPGLGARGDARPLSASSWVSGLRLKLSAVPGAGQCAEGQRVPRRGRCSASRPLEAAPVPAKETLATGPRGSKRARALCRAHRGAEGPSAPKPGARDARGQAAVTRESKTHRSTFPFFYFR